MYSPFYRVPNEKLHGGIHIVTYDWLVNSCNNTRREREYLYHPQNSEKPVAKQEQSTPPKINDDPDPAVPLFNITNLAPTPKPTTTTTNTTTVTHKIEQTQLDDEPDTNLFAGINLYIHPEHLEVSMKETETLLKEKGATIVTSMSAANLVLCSALPKHHIDKRYTYVTEFYFKSCITQEKRIDINEDPLYSTIPLTGRDWKKHLTTQTDRPIFSVVGIKESKIPARMIILYVSLSILLLFSTLLFTQ
jgi:hypothetical protein